MNHLQELVLTRLAELGEGGRPLSARRAAAKSRGGVSHETIYAIARGVHSGEISDRIAEGLAAALDVPAERVYEAAGVPRPQTRWLWPERFDRLNTAQRRLVEDVAAGLLEADRQGYERGRRAE